MSGDRGKAVSGRDELTPHPSRSGWWKRRSL